MALTEAFDRDRAVLVVDPTERSSRFRPGPRAGGDVRVCEPPAPAVRACIEGGGVVGRGTERASGLHGWEKWRYSRSLVGKKIFEKERNRGENTKNMASILLVVGVAGAVGAGARGRATGWVLSHNLTAEKVGLRHRGIAPARM